MLRQAAVGLNERGDELTQTLTREEGKTYAAASGEVDRAVDIVYYYTGKAIDHVGTVKAANTQ